MNFNSIYTPLKQVDDLTVDETQQTNNTNRSNQSNRPNQQQAIRNQSNNRSSHRPGRFQGINNQLHPPIPPINPSSSQDRPHVASGLVLSRYGRTGTDILLHGSNDEYNRMMGFIADLEEIKSSERKKRKWGLSSSDDDTSEDEYYNYFHNTPIVDDDDGDNDEQANDINTANNILDDDDIPAYIDYNYNNFFPSSEDEAAVSFDALLKNVTDDTEIEFHQSQSKQRQRNQLQLQQDQKREKEDRAALRQFELKKDQAHLKKITAESSYRAPRELQQVEYHKEQLPFLSPSQFDLTKTQNNPGQFNPQFQSRLVLQILFVLGGGVGLWGNDEDKIRHYNQVKAFLKNSHTRSPQPPIIIHLQALLESVRRLGSEVPFATISSLLQYQSKYYSILSSTTNLLNQQPFKLFHTTPLRYQQYNTKPHSELLGQEFVTTIMNELMGLFHSTQEMVQTNGTLHLSQIPFLNPLFSSPITQPLEHSEHTEYAHFSDFNDQNDSQTNRQYPMTSISSRFVSLVLSNPLGVFEAICHLKQLNIILINQLHQFSQLFHFLYTIFHFFGLNLVMSYYHLIVLQFIPQLSSSTHGIKQNGVRPWKQLMQRSMLTSSNNTTDSTATTTTSTTPNNNNNNSSLTHHSVVPISFINHLLTNATKYVNDIGVNDGDSISSNLSPSSTNMQNDDSSSPANTQNDHNSSSPTSHNSSQSSQFSLNTAIELQILLYAIKYSTVLQSSHRNSNVDNKRAINQLQLSSSIQPTFPNKSFDLSPSVNTEGNMGDDEIAYVNETLQRHRQAILKDPSEFYSISMSSAITTGEFINHSSLYKIDDLLVLLLNEQSYDIDDLSMTNNINTTTIKSSSPIPTPLDFSHLNITLPAVTSSFSTQRHADTTQNIEQATRAPNDYSFFTSSLAQSIITTCNTKRASQAALVTPLNQQYDVYNAASSINLDQELPFYSNNNYNNNNNNNHINSHLSSPPQLQTTSTFNSTQSIVPDDLTDLLFSHNLFKPLEDSLNNNNNNDQLEQHPQTYLPHNLFESISYSPPLLEDFLSLIFEHISRNIHRVVCTLYKSYHLTQSLSHFFYLYLITPRQFPTNHPLSLSVSALVDNNKLLQLWLRGYTMQYQLFTKKHNLFFHLTQIPIDLRLQSVSSLTSSRMLYLDSIGDGTKTNQRTIHSTSVTTPNTPLYLKLLSHYHAIKHTIFPIPFLPKQINVNYRYANGHINADSLAYKPFDFKKINYKTNTPHFYSNLPTFAIQTLIALLMTQYPDVYSTNQYNMTSGFFTAVELHGIETNQFGMNKRQRLLFAQTLNSPTIQVNLVNSLLYPPLLPSGEDNNTNQPGTQVQRAVQHHINHFNPCISIRFSFPKSFPGFAMRHSSRDRILATLEEFANLLYPFIFDQRDLSSSSSLSSPSTNAEMGSKATSLGVVESLSHYIYRLNDVLFIKTNAVPWLYDVSFSNSTLFTKLSLETGNINSLKNTKIDNSLVSAQGTIASMSKGIDSNNTTNSSHQLNNSDNDNIDDDVSDDEAYIEILVKKRTKGRVGVQQQHQPHKDRFDEEKDNNNVNNVSPQPPMSLIHSLETHPASEKLSRTTKHVIEKMVSQSCKEFDVLLVPIEFSPILSSFTRTASHHLEAHSEQIISSNSKRECKDTIRRIRGLVQERDRDGCLMSRIEENNNNNNSNDLQLLQDHISFYSPGLSLVNECRVGSCRAMEQNQLQNSVVGSSTTMGDDDNKHNQSISPNSSNQLPPLIPYKSYLIYLASILEVLCVLKSMQGILTDAQLSPPLLSPQQSFSSPSTPQSMTSQHGPSRDQSIKASEGFLQPSKGTREYDIYTIPNLFHGYQGVFLPFLSLHRTSSPSSSFITSQNGETGEMNSNNEMGDIRPEIMSLFNTTSTTTATTTTTTTSTPKLSNITSPPNTTTADQITQPISIHLPSYSLTTYRSVLATLLGNEWILMLLLTLHNPIHIFSLLPLYFDGGVSAGNIDSIQDKERDERKVVDAIGHLLQPTHAPKCPLCNSNNFIHMFTLSHAIASTKAEIYGTADEGSIVEKFTCKNPIGCGHCWIVKS